MQTKIILSVLLIAATALSVVLWREGAANKKKAAAYELRLEDQAKALATQRAKIERLEHQKSALGSEVDALAGSLADSKVAPPPATNPAPALADAAAKKAPILGKMMEDPQMRKMMGQQQKQIFQSIYRELAEKLKLPEEDREKLFTAIADNHTKNLELGTSLMGKVNEGVDKTEIAAAFEERKKEADAAIKSILGEEKFAEFEDYNQQLGNRMMVEGLKGRLKSGQAPLAEEQSGQLTQLLKEETVNVSTEAGLGADGHAKASLDWTNILFEDGLNAIYQRQEEINRRVLAKASAFLAPEQIEAFQGFQTNVMNMQKVQIDMARKMMGAEAKETPKIP